MIIDRMPLAGPAAYIKAGSETNLARTPGTPGVTEPIPEGKVIDVSELRFYLESKLLLKALPLVSEKPLLTVAINKEMFPSLFADPFSHRVHSVGGFEDFKRGESRGFRAMDVDGFATLVTTGTESSSWLSPMYRLPEAILLTKASWDLALSRSTTGNMFDYELLLEVWQTGQNLDTDHGAPVPLAAPGTAPVAERMNDDLRFANGEQVEDVIAYRVHFRANVRHDALLQEQHENLPTSDSLGSPLLRTVNLLENTPSSLAFYSLHELMSAAADFETFDVPEHNRLMVSLDLTSTLSSRETITVTVQEDVFEHVEARLAAEVRLRPPPTGQEAS